VHITAAKMIDDDTQWRRFIMSNQKQKEVKGDESQ
jgi:hypothetical protein